MKEKQYHRLIGALRLERALRKVKIPRCLIVRQIIEDNIDLSDISRREIASDCFNNLSFDSEIKARFCKALFNLRLDVQSDDIVRRAEASKVHIITPLDDIYPATFKHLYSPPLFLCSVGKNRELLRYPNIVTVIGSRRPSPYGHNITRRFVADWSALNIVIGSGMAKGIDGIAHQAALDSSGKTIAILGSGPDIIYPPDNRHIYDNIVENGIIISEYLPGTPPRKQHFPARNRLLSCLGRCLIVIEATRRSGTMITTNFALEQSIPVLAVPGNIDAPASQGTNRLIRDGCDVLLESTDLLPYLDIEAIGMSLQGAPVSQQTDRETPSDPIPAFSVSKEADTILSSL
ncbi:MAG TPA: DNA-protecting protein DprA, partial [Clostridiaceae bacterium]|nr:DNA-protecting protein DprA [Clostridiaceae bacterium]